LKGFSAKSKLIIFLLAAGYTPTKIREFIISDLLAVPDLDKIPDLERSVDLLKTGDGKDKVFSYPSGREYSESYIISILERCYQKNGLKYKNLDDFVKMTKSD